MKKNRWKKGIALFLSITAIFTGSMIPVQASEYWPQAPETASPCVMVMEMNTGAVLYEKNVDEVHYPASITKIMTTLIAIEKGKMDDIVTFSADAVYKNEGDTSHISRDLEEQSTLEQCLYGVMLESANECAYAVAEHIGGGDVSKFVDMMNEKAKELGCTNTHFNNTNGLPDEQHYTSTRDMLLIARAAYENEEFRKITGTKVYVIPPTNKHEDETTLHNHHNMLYPFRTAKYIYDGCTGGKTGYTSKCRYTLITYAKKNGMTLVSGVMRADSPWDTNNEYTDTIKLLNTTFEKYKRYNIQNDAVKEINNNYLFTKFSPFFNSNNSPLTIDSDAGVMLPKGVDISKTKKKITMDEKSSKIVDGKKVIGHISYTYNGKEIGGSDIYYAKPAVASLNDSIDMADWFTEAVQTANKEPFQWKRLAVILILVVVILIVVIYIIHRMRAEREQRERRKRYRRTRKSYKKNRRY